ncbi:ATP-binding protein [Novosphingobium sp. FKTRR1]|uniref:ATP-binding protein n=1 Tax=Novosphingobium sp. FKTRR1 TaxID=2879118 RepID=UPI001CF03B9E|nr:ATP-binding protein [Novosphingobium sp. FKTRR1]
MDPITNPYAPGAGSQPPELAGRNDVLERTRITLARVKQGRPAKSFMLVGLRGVGKTVLLNRIQEIAEEAGYRAALVETPEGKSLPEVLLPSLRRILLQLDSKEKVNEVVKRSLMVLKGFANTLKITVGEVEIGLGIDPAHGVADSGDLEADLPDLLEAVGRAAKARDTAVALIIDEVQYVAEAEFSALIMAVHRISQKQLPVVVIGAGLPQLVGLAGKSKSYAERLFDYPQIGALAPTDAQAALIEPARREGVLYEPDAVDEAVRVTNGYPYFLQEWGYHSWNAAIHSPITRNDVAQATQTALASLDESFFRVRFDRLTPREKAYLFAMAGLGSGPHRSGDIASRLNVAVESIAPVRSSLIKKGMVFSPAHGDTAFTVPMFDEYLARQQHLKP